VRGSIARHRARHRPPLAFDTEVERSIRRGDLAALLAIDPALAADLMATGRAAWQVLAGALPGVPVASLVRYCDDPFGVAYLVASLRVPPPTSSTR
jgi:hypothetical protein